MKGFLRKLFAMLITLGLTCAYTVPAWGAELQHLDFSDRDYLLPIDFTIQEQRAVEANYTENGYQGALRIAAITGPRIL